MTPQALRGSIWILGGSSIWGQLDKVRDGREFRLSAPLPTVASLPCPISGQGAHRVSFYGPCIPMDQGGPKAALCSPLHGRLPCPLLGVLGLSEAHSPSCAPVNSGTYRTQLSSIWRRPSARCRECLGGERDGSPTHTDPCLPRDPYTHTHVCTSHMIPHTCSLRYVHTRGLLRPGQGPPASVCAM